MSANPNRQPTDTTNTPNRKGQRNEWSEPARWNQKTNSVSAVMKATATTMPTLSGGD